MEQIPMNYSAHYTSPLGTMTMCSDGIRLSGLWFNRQKNTSPFVTDNLKPSEDLPVFQQTREWLNTYYSGKGPGFTPPLLLLGTPFRKAVWKQLATIPFGQTLTYGEVARLVGCSSARAVGGAVGHNPIALIIPCHRVIGKDGTLTGYAAGTDRKAFLLNLEGITYQTL